MWSCEKNHGNYRDDLGTNIPYNFAILILIWFDGFQSTIVVGDDWAVISHYHRILSSDKVLWGTTFMIQWMVIYPECILHAPYIIAHVKISAMNAKSKVFVGILKSILWFWFITMFYMYVHTYVLHINPKMPSKYTLGNHIYL